MTHVHHSHSGADLTDASLAGAELKNAELTQAKLSGAAWVTTAVCEPGSIGECRLDEAAPLGAPQPASNRDERERSGAV